MRELIIDARVLATDGEGGSLSAVILDPVARAVTHVVVREKGTGVREFIVPVDMAVGSSTDTLQVNCTVTQLQDLPEFLATRYVSASSPEAQPALAARQMEMYGSMYGYEPIYQPYVPGPDETVPILEARVPEGRLAFESGVH